MLSEKAAPELEALGFQPGCIMCHAMSRMMAPGAAVGVAMELTAKHGLEWLVSRLCETHLAAWKRCTAP